MNKSETQGLWSTYRLNPTFTDKPSCIRITGTATPCWHHKLLSPPPVPPCEAWVQVLGPTEMTGYSPPHSHSLTQPFRLGWVFGQGYRKQFRLGYLPLRPRVSKEGIEALEGFLICSLAEGFRWFRWFFCSRALIHNRRTGSEDGLARFDTLPILISPPKPVITVWCLWETWPWEPITVFKVWSEPTSSWKIGYLPVLYMPFYHSLKSCVWYH